MSGIAVSFWWCKIVSLVHYYTLALKVSLMRGRLRSEPALSVRLTGAFWLGSFLSFVTYFLWSGSNESSPAEYEPIFISAGSVTYVVLHESAFSTTSSVTTDKGVFQVSGAVTASTGDKAKVRVLKSGSIESKALCIESSFKPNCYNLLWQLRHRIWRLRK